MLDIAKLQWIQSKYITLLGTQLRNFKRKSATRAKTVLYNFSCPFCGDSKSNSRKARGYVYQNKEGKHRFACHNCNEPHSIGDLIKKVNPALHEQYINEIRETKLGITSTHHAEPPSEPVPQASDPTPIQRITPKLDTLQSIQQLDDSSDYRRYVAQRLIPRKFWGNIYACPNFMAWTNSQIPGTFKDAVVKIHDHARIVIPLYDESNKPFGYQGRILDTSESLKYITIRYDEDHPKIWGLDRIDKSKPVYALEGIFDAMFIDNAAAVCGGDVSSILDVFPEAILVFDNEPDAPITCKKIQKSIDAGHTVVIWPSGIVKKDINAMVLAGIDVQPIVEQNSYRGLMAQLQFDHWKKVTV